MAYYGWVREGRVVYLWPACPCAPTHKTGETVSHGQNNNVKEVGTSPVRSNLLVQQLCRTKSQRQRLKKQLWGTKDKPMSTYASYHCSLPPILSPNLNPIPTHPLAHTHSQLQGQRPAHTQQHKFYNLTNDHSLHRFTSSLPGRNDSNALMADKMTSMSDLPPAHDWGRLFCCWCWWWWWWQGVYLSKFVFY